MAARLIKYVVLGLLAVVGPGIGLVAWTYYENWSTPDEKWFSFVYPAFYLRVEDQHGEPVPDATIEYSHGSNHFWVGSNEAYSRQKTGPDGTVRISLDSRWFNLLGIHADGYLVNTHRLLFDVEESDLLDFTLRKHDLNLKQYGEDTPLLINVWRVGEAPTGFHGTLKLKLRDGEAAVADLWRAPGKRTCVANSPALKLGCDSVLSHDYNERRQFSIELNQFGELDPFEWSLSIEVPHGGVVVSDDRYFFDAPRSGYRSDWSKTHVALYFTHAMDDVYLKFDDGDLYAKLRLDVSRCCRDNPLVKVGYFVNTTGSTNLFFPLDGGSPITPLAFGHR